MEGKSNRSAVWEIVAYTDNDITYRCSNCGKEVKLPWGNSVVKEFPYCQCKCVMDMEHGRELGEEI